METDYSLAGLDTLLTGQNVRTPVNLRPVRPLIFNGREFTLSQPLGFLAVLGKPAQCILIKPQEIAFPQAVAPFRHDILVRGQALTVECLHRRDARQNDRPRLQLAAANRGGEFVYFPDRC